MEPTALALQAVVEAVADRALIMVDPNCRPSFVADRGTYRRSLAAVLRHTHVVKVSNDDLEYLEPGVDPLTAARNLLEDGPSVALVTLGGEGALIVTAEREDTVPAAKIEVVDTIGAGDAFGGGFLAYWRIKGLKRDALADPEAVKAATTFACVVAARTCERAGASPPRLSSSTATSEPRTGPRRRLVRAVAGRLGREVRPVAPAVVADLGEAVGRALVEMHGRLAVVVTQRALERVEELGHFGDPWGGERGDTHVIDRARRDCNKLVTVQMPANNDKPVLIDTLGTPIVLAPMAGGPSTPELAAAVWEAGGLGFVGAGYLRPRAPGADRGDPRADRRAVRRQPVRPGPAAPPAVYADAVAGLEREGLASRHAALRRRRVRRQGRAARRTPVAVVSFTFGFPAEPVLERLRAAGSEAWVTVTAPEEADGVAPHADALMVQGVEAGGHRGLFGDGEDAPTDAARALQLIGAAATAVDRRRRDRVRRRRSAPCWSRARAPHRSAPRTCAPPRRARRRRTRRPSRPAPTVLRARSAAGWPAGYEPLAWTHAADAPLAYPEIHYATSPLRAAARTTGDADLINLWAGEAHQLAEALPAAEIVRRLSRYPARDRG